VSERQAGRYAFPPWASVRQNHALTGEPRLRGFRLLPPIRPNMGPMESKTILYKGGIEIHFYRESAGTPEERNVFRCVIPPGARTPMPHYHAAFVETVRGHAGTATWVVDGKTRELRPGERLVIPRGAVHQFVNRTKVPVEFVCHVEPEIFGAPYFEDIATVVNVQGLPDFEQLQTVMKSHGVVPVLGLKQWVVFAALAVVRRLSTTRASSL
jgi:quercetin dioxygenase-like cupin family protein